MTAEEQRITIAEFCGKLDRKDGEIVEYQRWDEQAQGVFQRVRFPNGSVSPCYIENLPDYTHDLNAMNEAENCLDADQYESYFLKIAGMPIAIYSSFQIQNSDDNRWIKKILSAAAAQRAEALLRAVGRWKEDDALPQPILHQLKK